MGVRFPLGADILANDLERLLSGLCADFDRRGVRYALVGGFALGAHGAPRATRDLDFLVRAEDMGGVHELLTALGYERVHHTESVSQYAGPGPWGSLDFIHAFRPLSLEMLGRAQALKAGSVLVRVVSPEDLIGLKVQAVANDPTRRHHDLADIEALLDARPDLDWPSIKAYFDLFSLGAEYLELEKRFRRG
jgi:hypothetical protein